MLTKKKKKKKDVQNLLGSEQKVIPSFRFLLTFFLLGLRIWPQYFQDMTSCCPEQKALYLADQQHQHHHLVKVIWQSVLGQAEVSVPPQARVEQ